MGFMGLDDERMMLAVTEIERQLEGLTSIRVAVASACRIFVQHWHGSQAAALAHDMQRHHMSSIDQVRAEVEGILRELRHQVDQQQEASRAGGRGPAKATSSAPLGAPAVLESVVGGAGTALPWLVLKSFVLGAGQSVVGHGDLRLAQDALRRPYGEIWRRVVKWDKTEFLQYKKSPTLFSIANNKALKHVDKLFGRAHLYGALDKMGKLGTAMVVAEGVKDLAADSAEGHWGRAANDILDVTAAGLKTSKNPVAYLAGFNLGLWKRDFELAQKIDLRQGLPNPVSGTNLRDVYWATAKELPGDVFHELKDLL